MIQRHCFKNTLHLPALLALIFACFSFAYANGSTKNAPSAKSYVKAAYDAYTSGRYDEAIADYTKAIKLDPKNPAYYDYRANIYFQFENHYDKALAGLDKALSLKPAFERAYLDRGFLEYDMFKMDQAITDFNKAISLQPKDEFAYEGRAVTYDRKRDQDRRVTHYTELAIMDYSKAISLKPKFQFALMRRAQDYLDLNKLDLAEADNKKLVSLAPDDPTGYEGLATIYSREHDDARADAEYRKVAELDPGDPKILVSQGLRQYQKGDYDGAIDSYKKALSLHDKYLTRILDFEIGLTYGVEGNSVQAEMYCKQGIALASQGELYAGVSAGEQMLQAHPQSQALQKVMKEMQIALAAKGPMKYGAQTFGAN